MDKILSNPIVIENFAMLAGIMLCFVLAMIFINKYNRGSSKAFLILSRLLIIAAGIMVIIWIF